MRRPWSWVFLCFSDTRNLTLVPLTNYSIATNDSQNSLIHWVSTDVERAMDLNITGDIVIDETSENCSVRNASEFETLGNVTFLAATGCDPSMASLSSTMIDLLAFSKGEKVRKQVCRFLHYKLLVT